MPPAAAIGIGLGASAIGSALGASSSNKVQQVPVAAPSAVNPSLNTQYLSALSSLVGGSSMGGGASTGATGFLGSLISGGYNVLPQWQTMLQAAQPQIQAGQAALTEEFAGTGLRYSTPLMQATGQYQTNVQSQWLSTLAQLQQQSWQAQQQGAEYALGLAAGPGTQTYQPYVPVVGKSSVLGNALASGGSGLSTLALMQSAGLLS